MIDIGVFPYFRPDFVCYTLSFFLFIEQILCGLIFRRSRIYLKRLDHLIDKKLFLPFWWLKFTLRSILILHVLSFLDHFTRIKILLWGFVLSDNEWMGLNHGRKLLSKIHFHLVDKVKLIILLLVWIYFMSFLFLQFSLLKH